MTLGLRLVESQSTQGHVVSYLSRELHFLTYMCDNIKHNNLFLHDRHVNQQAGQSEFVSTLSIGQILKYHVMLLLH